MRESLFSPLWYRVAQQTPRLGHDVIVRQQLSRGQAWHVLVGAATGRQCRINHSAYLFVGCCDGVNTVQRIWDSLLQDLRDQAPTQDEVIQILARLAGQGFLEYGAPLDVQAQTERRTRRRSSQRRANVNPLAFRVPLGDPGALLRHFDGVQRLLFQPAVFWLWLFGVVLATAVAASHWQALSAHADAAMGTPRYLFLAWLAFPFIKTLHELGHALAVRHWGGEVHEAGVSLFVLTPAPYVDASAATLMELGNVQTLERLFHDVMVRDKSLASVAVRRSDGLIMAQAGDHASAWAPAADGAARLEHLQVPLAMNGHDWGGVEVSYLRPPSNSFWQWLGEPSALMVLLLGAGSFAAFTLYLRRVLSLLDPSAVIPERVRSAFDVFSGGVMIIDPACRLMMVNSALRNWMGGEADQALSSRAVETLDWFKSALSPDRNLHPWVQAMASGVAAQGAQLEFKLASGEPLRAVVNASPILDGTRKLRGCLVTFENVTPLHNLNLQLVKSMAELEESKREVEKKNDALQELATRDPLTGCLNRRALFSRLERLFLEAREKGHPLCCIMSDIDHFKQFNDRHGHAVGDQVLQAVTRSLGSALREVDLLARYGGEEFCIVLPDADLEQACAVAERLRTDVQGRAGQSIRSTSGLEVTSSFGVSVIDDGIVDPAQLIDRADKALYAAKEAGRNCVMTYQASALDDAALAEPVLH